MNTKELGKACLSLIERKMISKDISPEEYYAGILELDKKYPMAGHNPALTPYQIKHFYQLRSEVELVFNWEKDGAPGQTKIKYEDTLQPFNFRESAEMYIRKWGYKHE